MQRQRHLTRIVTLAVLSTVGCTSPPHWENRVETSQGIVRLVAPSDTLGFQQVLACWHDLTRAVAASPLPRLSESKAAIDIYLFDDEAEWRDWYGLGSTHSFADVFRSAPVAVYHVGERYAVLSPLVKQSSEDLELASQIKIRHELFHHLHFTTAPHRPERWLSEGLAELFAGRSPVATVAALQESLGNPNYYPLERYLEHVDWTELLDEVLGSASPNRKQYSLAFLLCDALLGSAALQQRFVDMIQLRECPADLEGLAVALECAPGDIVAALQARFLTHLLDRKNAGEQSLLRDPLLSFVASPPLEELLAGLEQTGELVLLTGAWWQTIEEDYAEGRTAEALSVADRAWERGWRIGTQLLIRARGHAELFAVDDDRQHRTLALESLAAWLEVEAQRHSKQSFTRLREETRQLPEFANLRASAEFQALMAD